MAAKKSTQASAPKAEGAKKEEEEIDPEVIKAIN
jgi:hypothetical protein